MSKEQLTANSIKKRVRLYLAYLALRRLYDYCDSEGIFLVGRHSREAGELFCDAKEQMRKYDEMFTRPTRRRKARK